MTSRQKTTGHTIQRAHTPAPLQPQNEKRAHAHAPLTQFDPHRHTPKHPHNPPASSFSFSFPFFSLLPSSLSLSFPFSPPTLNLSPLSTSHDRSHKRKEPIRVLRWWDWADLILKRHHQLAKGPHKNIRQRDFQKRKALSKRRTLIPKSHSPFLFAQPSNPSTNSYPS